MVTSERGELVFLKLGGSLLTDKTRAATLRPECLRRLAAEVKNALSERPETRLLIGHGSGSFGHFAGRRYGTREGVHDRAGWVGYAHVSATAARLNRHVVDAFLEAGVPVLNLQPSASALCEDGVLQALAMHPIRVALDHRLVPMLHGDVALDTVRGGTILSTEEILIYLAPRLRPDRVLLAGDVPGVLDGEQRVISQIRVGAPEPALSHLSGSRGVDVTGGMFSKVHAMIELVARHPNLSVRIFSGQEDGALQRALIDPTNTLGTELLA